MPDQVETSDPAVNEPALAEPQVAVKEKPQSAKGNPKKQPSYAVIVHNDEAHTWQYVIEVLQRVCGHDLQKAFVLTSQIHYTGRTIVWTGALEVAELKRDQIRGFGPDLYASQAVRFPLGVTLEPLPG
jgi:ATP-dependent Clp protease adaptor protein ClpS